MGSIKNPYKTHTDITKQLILRYNKQRQETTRKSPHPLIYRGYGATRYNS